MTSMNVYSKEQIDAKIPATTSASAGDVLTLDSNKDAVWQAPSGGGGVTKTHITTNAELLEWMANVSEGDMLVGEALTTPSPQYNGLNNYFSLTCVKRVTGEPNAVFSGSGTIVKANADYGFIYYVYYYSSTDILFYARLFSSINVTDQVRFNASTLTRLTNVYGIKLN